MKLRRGYTFMELLLAILLFSVAMVSVLQIFPINRRLLTQSAQQTQASFYAQEQVEKVRAVAYDNLTVGTYEAQAPVSTVSGDVGTQFERSTVVSLIDGNYAATNTDIGMKKIVVTVYWTERNVNRTYTLTTYANNI